jgi:lysozyme
MKHVQLIKHFESLHDGDLRTIGLQPKLCPANVWTEGWGRAIIDPATRRHLKGKSNAKRALALSLIKTETEAHAALIEDMRNIGELPAIRQIGKAHWDRLNADQKGAIISFTYNCGTGRPPYKLYENVRLFLEGKMSRTDLWGYWVNSVIRVGGQVLQGLVRRRTAEAFLFFTGELRFNG